MIPAAVSGRPSHLSVKIRVHPWKTASAFMQFLAPIETAESLRRSDLIPLFASAKTEMHRRQIHADLHRIIQNFGSTSVQLVELSSAGLSLLSTVYSQLSPLSAASPLLFALA